jgi:hypothetical protein
MSALNEMREFIERHHRTIWNATGLAAACGWTKNVKRLDEYIKQHASKRALRCARRLGCDITRLTKATTGTESNTYRISIP